MTTDSTCSWLEDWAGAEMLLGGAQWIDDLAIATKAILRRREVDHGSQLLRLALAYGLPGQSCRTTAVWGDAAMEVDLSGPGLFGRLKTAGDFLAGIAGRLMAKTRSADLAAVQWDGPPIRLVDGSMFTAHGGKGAQHRLHAAYDPMRGMFTSFELTSDKTGENLTRADIEKGTIVVGDRNYAKTWACRDLTEREAFYCVRTGVYSTRMLVPETGGRLSCAAIVAKLGTGDAAEMPVLLVESKGRKQPPLAARLLIFRASDACAKREKARIERSKIQHGATPRSDTHIMAGVMVILTNLPQDLWPAERVKLLYQLRWQIELAFKTLKSTFQMRHPPCKTAPMARVWILANLITALLAQHLSSARQGAFSPTAR